MSAKHAFLALRMVGPLQSWGFDSQYNRRNTGLMPTKSAIAGICCAALGYGRGTKQEHDFLASFAELRMTAIAIPRTIVKNDKQNMLVVRRLQDYHTVQNTRRASGRINTDCVLTHRQYLTDVSFGVILEGEITALEIIENAMLNPVWGVWLGRKSCIPTAPILAGLQLSRDEAVALLIGAKSLVEFTRQIEVEDFTDGRDSIPDTPLSFASDGRQFTPRRVVTLQAGEGV